MERNCIAMETKEPFLPYISAVIMSVTYWFSIHYSDILSAK